MDEVEKRFTAEIAEDAEGEDEESNLGAGLCRCVCSLPSQSSVRLAFAYNRNSQDNDTDKHGTNDENNGPRQEGPANRAQPIGNIYI